MSELVEKLRAMSYRPLPGSEAVEPISLEVVAERISSELPEDYREFLRSFPVSGATEDAPIVQGLESSPFAPDGVYEWNILYAGDNGRGVDLIDRYERFAEEEERQGYLPIGDDPGGNLFLMRLTSPGFGKIFFWDHELPFEAGLAAVSNSFSEFILSSELE